MCVCARLSIYNILRYENVFFSCGWKLYSKVYNIVIITIIKSSNVHKFYKYALQVAFCPTRLKLNQSKCSRHYKDVNKH